ncbi:MAG: hypothetical protein AAB582_03290 [Patescibacteria group bacterium]
MSLERGPTKRSYSTDSVRAASPEHREASPADSPYNFEKLSSSLKEAVSERVERILERTPIDKRYFSSIFSTDQGMIAPEELAYFQAYVRLAARQLVMGDFFGDEEPVRDESAVLRELKERPLGASDAALREYESLHLTTSFDAGTDLLHDIAHTWVDLAESDDRTTAANMIPKFLRYKQSIKTKPEIAEASAHDEAIVALYNTESLRNRGGILKGIQKARSREEFLDHDYLMGEDYTKTEPPAFKQYVRGRIYDEYKENPNLLFDLFAESTLPVMKVEAPSEAEALGRLRSSDIPRVF